MALLHLNELNGRDADFIFSNEYLEILTNDAGGQQIDRQGDLKKYLV